MATTLLFGPPFPTGKPHYGHILNFIMKDTILGFLGKTTMARFDVHGLPVELKVQENLQIDTLEEIRQKVGEDAYNSLCKKYVFEMMEEWPQIFLKLTKSIHFFSNFDYQDENHFGNQNWKKNGKYTTMDPTYMQNVKKSYIILKQKGLIYNGFKVQPYSAECETGISNFESKQNYKDIVDKSIYVKFKLVIPHLNSVSEKGTYLLAWTTTPYSLHGNRALCINRKTIYKSFCLPSSFSEEKEKEECRQNDLYIASDTFIKSKGFKPISKIDTDWLLKQSYENIYNGDKFSYKIISDDYVKDDNPFSTSIVHIAPAYGEDDYRCCVINNIIDIKEDLFDPYDSKMEIEIVDDNGINIKFKAREQMTDIVIKDLKDRNLLFENKVHPYKHSVPHCWRTDKPLYYKAIPCINLDIQKIKSKILENLEKINFINGVGYERMKEGIISAPDWCISRSRMWGNSIPSFSPKSSKSIDFEDFGEKEGIDESETDLEEHKLPFFDSSSKSIDFGGKKGDFKFDCWYESGSQFFAENENIITGDIEIDKPKVADFICEGIDQCRGWFYTLLVLGTALYDDFIPYKNVLVNGTVLDKSGIKFSKKLSNYKDPSELISLYGEDAVKLYFLNCVGTKGQDFKFDEEEIKLWNKNIVIPFKNVISLYEEYNRLSLSVVFPEENPIDNVINLDFWIISKLNQTIFKIQTKIKEYKLDKISFYIFEFVEDLSKRYCKYNKDNIKGKNGSFDALRTLEYIFASFNKNIAKIVMPNLSLNLDKFNDKLVNLDKLDFKKTDKIFEYIDSILAFRSSKKINMIMPISSIYIVAELDDLNSKELEFLKTQTNALNISFLLEDELEINYIYVPNFKEIGKSFGKETKSVSENIKKGNIIPYSSNLFEVEKKYSNFIYLSTSKMKMNLEPFCLHFDNQKSNTITLFVDETVNQEIKELHIARFFATKIQEARKNEKLKVYNKINIFYYTKQCELIEIIDKKRSQIIDIIGQDVVFKDFTCKEFTCKDFTCEDFRYQHDIYDYNFCIFIEK